MMNILKYIMQGLAHELVVFFNFIDFSWFFFVFLGIILFTLIIKTVYKNLLNVFNALVNVIKIPIIFLGILLILGMYILTAYLFDDSLSFYFIAVTLISLVKDIYDFNKDTCSDISVSRLIKTTINLAKGAFLLLLIRFINIIDTWDFSNLKYIYIYLIYLFSLLILTLVKKIYLIIDEHRCRCHIKGGHCNRFALLFIYTYSLIYVKDLGLTSNALFAFYNHERTTTLKTDLPKIKAISIKLKSLKSVGNINLALLRRIGVDNYEKQSHQNH